MCCSFGPGRSSSLGPSLALIHPTSGKRNSANFACIGFYEVRRYEERGATPHKKRAGRLIPALDVAFSRGLSLGVGPYLALDLLD